MRYRIAGLVAVIASSVCLAQPAQEQKLRDARAAAASMVRPSGPLRMETPASNTPREWQARPRIVGTYSNYATRNTFVLPYLSYGGPSWFGWGFGSCGWFGFGFSGGWYPLGGYSCGYSGW